MKTPSRFLIPGLFLLLFAGLGWQRWELLELRAQLNTLVQSQPPGAGPDVFRQAQHAATATRQATTPSQGSPSLPTASAGSPATGPQVKGHLVIASGNTPPDWSGAGPVASRSGLSVSGAGPAEDPLPTPPETTGLDESGQPFSWSHRQAAGPPDTPEAGDYRTAWAPRSQDGGAEWLKLKYPQATEIATINIHETYNPGAVSKVTARLPDGSEKVIWEGVEPGGTAPVETTIQVPPGVRSDQITVHMDTTRVAGWNEIDAVEIIGRNGKSQWASESSASSYYGDQYSSNNLVFQNARSQ